MRHRVAGLVSARDRVVVAGTIAALGIAGCSSTKTTEPPPPTGSVALWVVGDTSLLGYSTSQLASGTSAAPKVSLTAVASAALAFDGSGNLWVAGDQQIAEYAPSQLAASGNPTAKVTLTTNDTSLISATSLAFDAHGNLWVGNNNGSYSTIVEYTTSQLASSGSPVPAVTLTTNNGSLYGPNSLAFDHSGNLWVANLRETVPPFTVVEFSVSQLAASGSPIPAVTLTDDGKGSLSGPWGLAFDGAGNLWVANIGVDSSNGVIGGGTVVQFASSQLGSTGSPTPAITLTSSGTLTSPSALAFDAHANLWVEYFNIVNSTGAVYEFTASQLEASGAPTPTVTISGNFPSVGTALAFVP